MGWLDFRKEPGQAPKNATKNIFTFDGVSKVNTSRKAASKESCASSTE